MLLPNQFLSQIHKSWQPHEKQTEILLPLFLEGVTDIFIQAGRSFGKTELMAYLLWRWAIENPGSENYYFAPFMKQAREILWASQRVQTFGPRECLASKPNNTEMRLTFKNGSFIKLDGSDNVDAYRGIKPKGLSVFDEFKDFRPEFYPAYDPNRARYNAPIVIIGTPPEKHCQFVEVASEFKHNKKKRWFTAPTKDNPFIPKDWLDNKKKELLDKGEDYVWFREYEAIFVPGGTNKIFQMLSDKIIKPHQEIINEIYRDRNKLEWILFCDPAAASVFAVLFVAHNPYSKKIYILDEIYEKDQNKMTVGVIFKRILEMKKELHDGEWRQGYDEAEKWFASEVLSQFNEFVEPSFKSATDKESGLSITKDLLLKDRIVISDRCHKFFWEMDNYFKDKNGNIPKKDDHLIDCFRYILIALGYTFQETKEVIPTLEKRIDDYIDSMFDDNYD